MCDIGFMNKEFLTEFIKIYRKHSALWDRNYKNYYKRAHKEVGFEALLELYKQIKQNADRDDVVKKIQSLRGSFRKEHRKVQKSIENGDESIYVPSLWYYDLLLFTVSGETQQDVQNLSDNESETVNEDFNYSNKNFNTISFPDTFNTQVHTFSKMEDTTLKTNNFSYEIPEVQVDVEAFTDISEISKVTFEEDDAFGNYIALKLGKIKVEQQKMFAEVLLTQIVNKAILNQLTPNTVLSE
ncbi:uncharacterized protein LOC143917955 [Arctopsyche grandis]|uniref:uncharacterized protein LOC143917955 n=1 Tax=Arctopsyche grandis TaxID=121162 RepID=UPI00406D7949